MGKDSMETDIRTSEKRHMHDGEVAPLKQRVAADHAASSVQLKAEQAKEMAALKAEEAQRTAELKADHAKTPGKTGLIAKLMGKEDPVKKAEKQQLKAEIARAEDGTKAAHAIERSELDAQRSKENASLTAAEKMGGTGLHGAHGASVNQHRNDDIYNHATGAHGLAALADDGIHHEHHGFGAMQDNGLSHEHHHHHEGRHEGQSNEGGHANQHGAHGAHGGLNQGGLGNNGGFQQVQQVVGQVPVVAAMPVAAAVPLAATTHTLPATTHTMPATGTHTGAAVPVTVIAPGKSGHY
jgi:hypothetical protein